MFSLGNKYTSNASRWFPPEKIQLRRSPCPGRSELKRQASRSQSPRHRSPQEMRTNHVSHARTVRLSTTTTYSEWGSTWILNVHRSYAIFCDTNAALKVTVPSTKATRAGCALKFSIGLYQDSLNAPVLIECEVDTGRNSARSAANVKSPRPVEDVFPYGNNCPHVFDVPSLSKRDALDDCAIQLEQTFVLSRSGVRVHARDLCGWKRALASAATRS
ncbi:hypothetical protein BC835DRAFT_1308859 [Cytidiella melzeri]|nr:hypothetical protein BC835DRAFT_1308859 [Cytidiella melzeri]